MKPLLYLELRQFTNSLKNIARSPKRLIPVLVVGAGMMAWIIQMLLLASLPHHGAGILSHAADIPSETIRAGAFLFLCFGSLAIIYQAFSQGSMVFSIAHIDFLFPTPISRRSVLLVKLIKDYLRYAFYVAFYITIAGAPAMALLNVSLFPYAIVSIAALTAYLLFIVNFAHTVNIIFTFEFERLKQMSLLIKLVLGLVFASALVMGVRQYIATNDYHLSVLWAANSPIIKTVFAPADWCSTLLLAPLLHVADADWTHLGMLWILAAASFGILMSRKENIYEPAIGISVRMTKLRQALRSGDATAFRVQMMQEKGKTRAGLITFPPFGRGAVALLWRGLITRYRMSWVQLAAMLIMPAVIMFVVQRNIPEKEVLKYLPFVLGYMTFILSITVQPQVRVELKQANILKSMPISSWKIMLVQTLNGSLLLSAGILVFAAAMWVFVPVTRTDLLMLCVMGSIFLGFACVSVSIIPALMYPDTRDSVQNLLCNLFGMMLISIAIIPTVVLGLVLLGLAGTSTLVALIPICVANIVIGLAGTSISGAIFRKFDPTCE